MATKNGTLTDGSRLVFSLDGKDKEEVRRVALLCKKPLADLIREMVKNVLETFERISTERRKTVPEVMRDLLQRPVRVRKDGWERNQHYENRERIPVFFLEKEKEAIQSAAALCEMSMSELVGLIVKSQLKAFEVQAAERDKYVTRAIKDIQRCQEREDAST